ncbi:MAG TPA: hypothetical protein VKR61_21775 [Bryobacteraceae bacterium]|nr:hypothetical protein [Bryobacteraceae bacterium]
MTAPELDSCARTMQRLVAEERYAEAQRAFEDYCRKWAEMRAGLPGQDPRIPELDVEWRRVAGEARRRVLADRAHAALRLARLARPVQPYGERPPARRTWECLA